MVVPQHIERSDAKMKGTRPQAPTCFGGLAQVVDRTRETAPIRTTVSSRARRFFDEFLVPVNRPGAAKRLTRKVVLRLWDARIVRSHANKVVALTRHVLRPRFELRRAR